MEGMADDQLPDDVASLKALLKKANQKIAFQQQLIDAFEEQRRLALARQFSPSSEKEALQYRMFDEAESEVEASPDVESVSTEVKAHKRRGGRRSLPSHLPRIEIQHDLPEAEKRCPCGCQKERIGEEVSEQIDIIPAKVQVLKHIRFKYACKQCDGAPETAPMPPQPIPKSQASPGFLAYIVTSKYADALPLYRQCHILKRSGIDYARNTLCHQVVKAGELLQPLINLMHEQLLEYPVLQMDETTVQVLKEPGRTAQNKSYMWVMRGGPPDQRSILFNYDPGRGQQVATRLLADYRGYLQTDAWHAYDAVHSDTVAAVGCWAHARRKFKDAEKALGKGKASPRLTQAIAFIQKLYAVEKPIKNADTETRLKARQENSLPILTKFKAWLDKQNVNPSSKLGEAILYTLKIWSRLTVYCSDGRLEIDNNEVENKIRPFAVGRKNWLFSTSQSGAKSSANLYSIIETAKANGLNEYEYLRWLFTKLPSANSVEDFESLLPWNIEQEKLVNWVYA